jgi:hypothetical protein
MAQPALLVEHTLPLATDVGLCEDGRRQARSAPQLRRKPTFKELAHLFAKGELLSCELNVHGRSLQIPALRFA